MTGMKYFLTVLAFSLLVALTLAIIVLAGGFDWNSVEMWGAKIVGAIAVSLFSWCSTKEYFKQDTVSA